MFIIPYKRHILTIYFQKGYNVCVSKTCYGRSIFIDAAIFNLQRFCLHDGPGIRTSVFFYGCNLRCQWCANPECFLHAPQLPQARAWEVEPLLAEILKDKPFYDKSGGGVTLTGGEVLLHLPFIRALSPLLRKSGVHIAAETNGAASEENFCELLELTDYLLMDCKHYDAQRHRQGTGVSNEAIVANLKRLAESKKPCCVRIPVIPGFNDAPEDALGFARLFGELGIHTVELLPFHQLGEGKYEKSAQPYAYAGVKQLRPQDLQSFRRILEEASINVLLEP